MPTLAPARSGQKSPASASWWRSTDALALAALLAVTLVVFSPALTAAFSRWDDPANITRNIRINPVRPQWVARFWTAPYQKLYIPLTYTLWALLALAGRRSVADPAGLMLDAWPFHLANLLVHCVTVAAAYLLLARLTRQRLPAAAGALLLAIHPLQVEPVAWATGMKDLLCGALTLLSLLHYLRFAEANHAGQGKAAVRRPLLAAWIAYALAILAKPTGIVIPLMAIALDRWIVGRSWKRIAKATGPMLALAIIAAAVTMRVQTVARPADGGRVALRPLIAADAVAFYLWKLDWPVNLAMQYRHDPMTVLENRSIYFTWVAPVGVGAVMGVAARRRKWLLVAGVFFLAPLLPVLGLAPFEFQHLSTVADRYMYVAMLGPALVAAMVVRLALTHARRPVSPALVATGIAAVAMLLAIASYRQARIWRDSRSLFTHALAVNPNSYAALGGMAALEARDGQFANAEAFARRAIAIHPDRPEAYVTLAVALQNRHDLPGAIALLDKALQVSPQQVAALTAMGNALAAERRFSEAEDFFRRAIAGDPEAVAARRSLAALLAATHRFDDALKEEAVAVDMDPDDAQGQTAYAMLLARGGDRQSAVAHVREALRLHPDDESARRALERLTQ